MTQAAGSRRQVAGGKLRKQEPGAHSTGKPAIIASALLFIFMSACASAPSYPEPQGSNGQVLVLLKGEAKEGAGGAKREVVEAEYSRSRQSVEKGRAFERVDYEAMDDVVVILEGAKGNPATKAGASELELGEDGFSRTQMLSTMNSSSGASFTVRNLLDSPVAIFGFNEGDGSFDASIGANSLGTIKVTTPGRYDVYCEEDETAHCVLFVTESRAWIGSSDEGGFFDNLPPGEYEVTVYPPRLPEWSKKVTVTAGKRTTLTAELTVNNLPKVGK